MGVAAYRDLATVDLKAALQAMQGVTRFPICLV